MAERLPAVKHPAQRFASAPEAPASSRSAAAIGHFLFGSESGAFGLAALAPRRADGGIWLSSCEASPPSERARRAAERSYERLTAPGARPLPDWFASLRRRIAALFGASDAETILAASEGEAEQVFLALSASLHGRPITFIAATAPERPAESDAPFTPLPLRDRYGLPRAMDEIDAEAERLIEEAVARGGDAVLHLTDCSQTGLHGPSRAAARRLAEAWPGRVMVLVDARQLRCAPSRIAEDLRAGFAVLLSGSTFAGGPAGAAALLLPPGLAFRVGAYHLPQGAVSAAMNWPPRLRDLAAGEFSALADLGLGLRWECALAELEPCFALAPALREKIAAAFAREIHRHLAATPCLKLADGGWSAADSRSLFPILAFDERGRPLKAEALWRALADPAARRGGWTARGRPVHLGRPTPIGSFKALRLCLSAAQVNAVAEEIAQGRSFAAAFQPLADDLLETFSLWSELASAGGF
jgi:hypothetical protein